jgi:hypothetical protein
MATISRVGPRSLPWQRSATYRGHVRCSRHPAGPGGTEVTHVVRRRALGDRPARRDRPRGGLRQRKQPLERRGRGSGRRRQRQLGRRRLGRLHARDHEPTRLRPHRHDRAHAPGVLLPALRRLPQRFGNAGQSRGAEPLHVCGGTAGERGGVPLPGAHAAGRDAHAAVLDRADLRRRRAADLRLLQGGHALARRDVPGGRRQSDGQRRQLLGSNHLVHAALRVPAHLGDADLLRRPDDQAPHLPRRGACALPPRDGIDVRDLPRPLLRRSHVRIHPRRQHPRGWHHDPGHVLAERESVLFEAGSRAGRRRGSQCPLLEGLRRRRRKRLRGQRGRGVEQRAPRQLRRSDQRAVQHAEVDVHDHPQRPREPPYPDGRSAPGRVRDLHGALRQRGSATRSPRAGPCRLAAR